jgi:hypothetical protein
MRTQRCSLWYTHDVFICALRCVCGVRSLRLKYLEHICMYDSVLSWSARTVLAARWCVLISHTSTHVRMCGFTLILCVISLCLILMLRGGTAMMAYVCSASRKYVLFCFQLLRRCRTTPSLNMISYNIYKYMSRQWRGAWTLFCPQRAWWFMYFRGCAHACAACTCVEPCVKVVFHCVFTVVFTATRVDVCVVLLLSCFVALPPCPGCERRCCDERKLTKYVCNAI